MFIDHADSSSLTPPSDEDRISYGDVEILQSKFFSSFSEFDYSSSFRMIRLTMVKVSTSSMRIYMPNATLICYTLGGEGDVHSNGKTVHCRKYDCVCVDCRQQPNFRLIQAPLGNAPLSVSTALLTPSCFPASALICGKTALPF